MNQPGNSVDFGTPLTLKPILNYHLVEILRLKTTARIFQVSTYLLLNFSSDRNSAVEIRS